MAANRTRSTPKQLAFENDGLRTRLAEAEETLRAIRGGEVDALIVATAQGDRVFTLQGADRSYRALVETMNEGALTLTGEGMILYANQCFAAMLKAPLEKVIGSDIHQWVASECSEALQTLLQDGGSQMCRVELSLAASDGAAVPAYLSANPVAMDGVLDCIGVVATDLSAQKRAEQAIRTSEAKFRNVFENSQLGKALVSMDGEVRFNKAFCETLGYTEEELQGKTWEAITFPDDIPQTADVLRTVLDGSIAGARFEKRYVHKNGSLIWADTTISIMRDGAGQPLYVLTAINDITGRKEADAALLDLKQHMQRNIEIERLRLAQDLHDIPLQNLYGVIYVLEDLRSRSDSNTAGALASAISDVQNTLSSLRAIASELRPPSISRFGLEKAARSYIEDFREKNPGIHITQSLARDGQMLPESVRLVLFRILQESLTNISRHAEATEVDVGFRFDAEDARLEIADNGRGFEVPINWLEMVREGHYGLAGMSERVSAAGGRLELESAPGGSKVRVVIPYTPA